MDFNEIHNALRRRYAKVAGQPVGQFKYPVGRVSVEQLGYPSELVGRVSADVVDLFVGVGNPFSLGEPRSGWRLVDVGCGAGFDSRIAAQYVGPKGRVVGVDMSPEMLNAARSGTLAGRSAKLGFVQGCAESLPLESGWADLVISNGVLNLSTCKASAFAEVARVLRPGGRFQAADLILVKDLPPDLRHDEFAWSN